MDMMEKFLKTETVSTLKSEHLKEGERPINVCLEKREDFLLAEATRKFAVLQDSGSKIHSLDMYDSIELSKNGIKNGGNHTYAISPVDDYDKYSQNYREGTGIIVAGKSKETGQDISFMTHQNPDSLLQDGTKFVNDLHKQLEEIRSRCEAGSIDAVIFGGRYAKVRERAGDDLFRGVYMKEYLDSIGLVSREISQVLGFEPVVVGGPKTRRGHDAVLYENKLRRVYLGRSSVDSFSPSFEPHDIDQVKKNFRPREWGMPGTP